MLACKGRVKGLDAKRRGVVRETLGSHQCEGAEASDIAIVNRSTVVQRELDGGVRALSVRKVARVDEQGAGEPRLNDDSITRREIEDDELSATPAALDDRVARAARQLAGRHLAKHIGFAD